MFSSWIKRDALKRKSDKRSLLIASSSHPNAILLLSLIGCFIVIGLFVMTQAYAAGTYFGDH